MRSLRRNTAAKWGRFALKVGLLLTDAKLWSSISNQLRDRASDLGDGVRNRYDDTMDRVQDASDAFRGRNHGLSSAVGFIGGLGLGLGLGIIFAPVSGEETRSAIRDRVVDMKNKMSDMAVGVRARGMESSGTGTLGD
jgi:gas vesicle protein